MASASPQRHAHSLPKSDELDQQELEDRDEVTTNADRDQSVIDDDEVDAVEVIQEPAEQQISDASDSMDGTTPNDTSVQQLPENHSQAAELPIEVGTSEPGSLSPTRGFGEEDGGANPPSDHAMVVVNPSLPHTPRQAQSAQVLINPAGVAKRSKRSSTRPVRPYPPMITPESAVPSEEDLLFVLMNRCRERGEAAEKSMTKIRTLEHRNFELHRQTEELCRERDAVLTAHTEANEKSSTLQTRLEDFKSKYYKLKDFARSTHQDLVSLRQTADVQKASFQELRQLGDEVQISLRDAGSGMQIVRSSLERQRQDIAIVRSEADGVISESLHASAELTATSNRVRELMKEKGRLEGHIVNLGNAQQRATLAARASNQAVSTALAGVNRRLDGIQSATSSPPLAQEAIDQCLSLLQTLEQKEVKAAADFEKLAKSVRALKVKVKRGVESIGEGFQSLQAAKGPDEIDEVLNQLEKYTTAIQVSADSREYRVRMEERLKSAQALIDQLRKSLASAESQITTVSRGMERAVDSSKAERDRSTQLQNQGDQYQVRWNAMRSELATAKKEFAEKKKEISEETSKLQNLLSTEQSERTAAEENLKVTSGRRDKILQARIHDLEAEVGPGHSFV